MSTISSSNESSQADRRTADRRAAERQTTDRRATDQKAGRVGQQSDAKPAAATADVKGARVVKSPDERVAEAFGDKPKDPIQDRIDVAFKPEDGMTDSVKSVLGGLEAPKDPTPGEKIAETAAGWAGKEFKPGEEARCADFVSQVVKESGVKAPNFEATVRARDFAKMGQQIAAGELKPGDIVAFNDTYRRSSNPKDHTHVGVYVGDGEMVHRPTKDQPVERVSLDEYLSRPTNDESRERSMVGGYRLTK